LNKPAKLIINGVETPYHPDYPLQVHDGTYPGSTPPTLQTVQYRHPTQDYIVHLSTWHPIVRETAPDGQVSYRVHVPDFYPW
jgi:hypothetical protein